jgi:hypothetical protein
MPAQFVGGEQGGNADQLISNGVCASLGLNPFSGGNHGGHSERSIIQLTCAPLGLNPCSGGHEDGQSDLAILNSVCSPLGVNPFYGGIEDGSSDGSVIQSVCPPLGLNPYYGGQEDGHADMVILQTSCIPAGVNPYTGGEHDGHADLSILQTLCAPQGFNPYAGGEQDGHSDNEILSSLCSSTGANPFYGGSEDGHADFEISVTSCNIALPVQLMYFSSQCIQGRVDLQWATASEQENNFFIIEKADPTGIFHEIGTRKGKHASNSFIPYSFADINPSKGEVFYRLSQVDKNKNQNYLQTISSHCGQETFFMLSPNPNAGVFTMQLAEEGMHVWIYNAIGNLVFQCSKQDVSTLEVNASSWAAGVYYVVSQQVNHQEVIKMVIEK